MPGRRQPPVSPEEFIAGATAAPESQKPSLPWQDPRVRDDLRVQLNTKLPERLSIQIEYLHRQLNREKQDIVEEALRAWVRQQLKALDLPSD